MKKVFKEMILGFTIAATIAAIAFHLQLHRVLINNMWVLLRSLELTY